MKKNFLGVVSSVAVLSAFLGNVHAVSVSNVGWNLTDLVKPVSTSTTSYSRTTKQPAELLSGFSASPSSSTSYQADYDRLWNYYNSDNFVESYQEAYRKALIERGFDSSYADRMTASEIKANAVAAFTSPERSAASDRQVSAFSGSAVPLTSTEIQQYAPGAYPGIGTVAGLQPVGYYVGQTQGSIQAQPLGQPIATTQQEYAQTQQIPQQAYAQPQQLTTAQPQFIQPGYVQANASYAQYQGQGQVPTQAQYANGAEAYAQQLASQYSQTQIVGNQVLGGQISGGQVSGGQATLTTEQIEDTVAATTIISTEENQTETIALLGTSGTAQSNSFISKSIFQPTGYISAKLGVNSMFENKYTDPSADFIALDHKLGFGGSLAAGMYLNQFSNALPAGLRAELEVAMLQAEANEGTTSLSGTPPVPTENRRFLAGMMNLAYDADTGSQLVPYFGVGLGMAKITGDDYTFGGLTIKPAESASFAGQIFGGMKYRMTDNMSLDVSGRYLGVMKGIVGTDGTDTAENTTGVVQGSVGVTFNF